MDGESYDYSDERSVVARKIHVCCECGDVINRGEEYEYFKGVFDGEWEVHKTCKPCRRIGSDYCLCVPFGQLWEYLEECIEGEGGLV
jgi:predicted RNA-binding Zn-ribbon protein involved in translation (DUF1610 family)